MIHALCFYNHEYCGSVLFADRPRHSRVVSTAHRSRCSTSDEFGWVSDGIYSPSNSSSDPTYVTSLKRRSVRSFLLDRLEDSQERTFHTESEELLEVHSPQGNLMTKSENGLKFNSNEFDDADISEEFFKESSEEWEEVFLNDFLQEPITSTQRTTQQPKTSSCDRQSKTPPRHQQYLSNESYSTH